jgi:hypothetical protein
MEAKCRGRSDSLVSLGNGKEGTNMYVSIKVDSLVTTATYKYSIKCAINLHLNGFFKLECFCRLALLASGWLRHGNSIPSVDGRLAFFENDIIFIDICSLSMVLDTQFIICL